jgi:hypothetical protein
MADAFEVPLRSRRLERAQFVQKLQHGIPATGLLFAGVQALARGAEGFKLGLALVEIVTTGLLLVSVARALRRLRRTARSSHHAGHGVDWAHIWAAGGPVRRGAGAVVRQAPHRAADIVDCGGHAGAGPLDSVTGQEASGRWKTAQVAARPGQARSRHSSRFSRTTVPARFSGPIATYSSRSAIETLNATRRSRRATSALTSARSIAYSSSASAR